MALAELRGPAVLFTRDKVFERFGLAVTDSLTAAQTLLLAAGLEANGANAMLLAGYVLEATVPGVGALVGVAARRPGLTAAALAGALWYLRRTGRLTAQQHADPSGALTVVEATLFATAEQTAARRLARCSVPLPRQRCATYWSTATTSRCRRRGCGGNNG